MEDETSTSSVSPGAEDKASAMLKNPDDLTQFVISGKTAVRGLVIRQLWVRILILVERLVHLSVAFL